MNSIPKYQISLKSVKRFSDCVLRNTNWQINFNVRRRTGEINFHIHKTDGQINFNMAETKGHVSFNVHSAEIRRRENPEHHTILKFLTLKYLFYKTL